MKDSLKPLLLRFDVNGPASNSSIEAVEAHFGWSLPEPYKAFLLDHDGGEGFVGDQYLILWRASELISFNEEYEVEKYAPGLLLFGSNGGGEAFAFDTRDARLAIRMVPFIGMSLKDATLVEHDFDKFLAHLAEPNVSLP